MTEQRLDIKAIPFQSLNNSKNNTLAPIKIKGCTSSLTVQPNSSLNVVINYGEGFKGVPFVSYTLMCQDTLFSLSHYLVHSICNSCTICVENSANTPRTISILYNIKA